MVNALILSPYCALWVRPLGNGALFFCPHLSQSISIARCSVTSIVIRGVSNTYRDSYWSNVSGNCAEQCSHISIEWVTKWVGWLTILSLLSLWPFSPSLRWLFFLWLWVRLCLFSSLERGTVATIFSDLPDGSHVLIFCQKGVIFSIFKFAFLNKFSMTIKILTPITQYVSLGYEKRYLLTPPHR